MKLRKIIATAVLGGALVIGTATTAAADTYNQQNTVGNPGAPGTISAPAAGLPAVGARAQFTISNPCFVEDPADLAEDLIEFCSGGNGERFLELTVESPSGQATIAGTVSMRQAFRNNSAAFNVTFNVAGEHTLTARAVLVSSPEIVAELHTKSINIAAPAAGAVVADTRPTHPATGAETVLYAVGGMLLAGTGVAVAASAKRRKAELV